MKKLFTIVVSMMLALTVIAFTGCNSNKKYVANICEDADNEQYGFCVGKSATSNKAILDAMNNVIANTDIDAAVTYYTAVSNDQTPTNTLSIPDLSDNTAGTLIVYTCSGFEPYEFTIGQSQEVVGVDIYLMSLVCEQLNMKIDVKDVDFDTIVGKVKTEDNAVGAAGITITAARQTEVSFSNPYFSSVQCVISLESEAFTKLDQLKGKKIGVQKGTTGNLLVDSAIKEGVLKDTNTTLVEYDTGAVAYTALKAGKIDYIVIDELPAKKLVG